jgi:hypothetical protein
MEANLESRWRSVFLTSTFYWGVSQLLFSQSSVLAAQANIIRAVGTIPALIEVKAPDQASITSTAQSNDGKAVEVEVQDPVTIQSNVALQVSLSTLALEPPAGVPVSAVAGRISLIRGDSEWLATDTNQGNTLSVDVPLGTLEAKVRFSFYSTTPGPLRPGVYTGTTVLTSIDN